MIKKKRTNQILITVALALLICFAWLIVNSSAYFTDKAQTQIQQLLVFGNISVSAETNLSVEHNGVAQQSFAVGDEFDILTNVSYVGNRNAYVNISANAMCRFSNIDYVAYTTTDASIPLINFYSYSLTNSPMGWYVAQNSNNTPANFYKVTSAGYLNPVSISYSSACNSLTNNLIYLFPCVNGVVNTSAIPIVYDMSTDSGLQIELTYMIQAHQSDYYVAESVDWNRAQSTAFSTRIFTHTSGSVWSY